MPITLTVSHLPSACSFFLSALQPLGYRYLYGRAGRVGLGVHEADFFIQQSNEPPGTRSKANHIRFHATSRAAVREFYARALNAGARPSHPPADRVASDVDVFNTFVIDRDGNSIEVSFANDPDGSLAGSEIDRSGVLNWQRGVADSTRSQVSHASRARRSSMSKAEQSLASARRSVVDDAYGSHVSRRTARSSGARSVASAASRSRTPTEVIPQVPPPPSGAGSIMPTLFREFSGPIETILTKADPVSGTVPTKTVVGTMLGAAAGAAFAYAMCTSEDGARREQWRYVKWDGDGKPESVHGESVIPVSRSQPSLPLPEAMSKLAIEAPPSRPPMPGAPVAPSYLGTHRSSRRGSRSEVNAPSASGSRRRSNSISSAHTVPAGSSHSRPTRKSTHPPTSYKHSSHHTSHRSSSRHSSRSSATLVPDNQQIAMVEEKYVPEQELDVETATVAPSDSISCAGDKYSARGARRSMRSGRSSGKYMNSWYGGNYPMERIIEIDRELEPLSARRVTRLVY